MPARLRYLVPGLLCFALAYAGWSTAKQSGYNMMPMPDPPPPEDPYWVQQADAERWFTIGCCSTPLFGIAGLVLIVVSFLGSGSRGGPPAG